jgi:hypothetical protein
MIKKIALLFFVTVATGMSASDRPNILWIYLEDVSGWFSCYGDKVIKTPHIDSLAKVVFALIVSTPQLEYARLCVQAQSWA